MSGAVDRSELAAATGKVVTLAADCYRCECIGKRDEALRKLVDLVDWVDEMARLFPRTEVEEEEARRDEKLA